MHVIGIPQGKRADRKIFEGLVAKHFPNLMKQSFCASSHFFEMEIQNPRWFIVK